MQRQIEMDGPWIANLSYSAQAGWPQSQAISTSSAPASLHNWLQYFSSDVTTHLHERCAHFFCSSFAMMFSFLPEVFLEADTG